MKTITPGDHIPAFSLQATSGVTVTHNELVGKNTVIYFYPKDSTPGCTTEGQDFKAKFDEFAQQDCQIFGVSRDSLRSHENFKCKQTFPFELISDPEEVLCNLFDVIKLKKLYGKEYLGVDRSTFLVNKQGKLVKEWRSVKVSGHVAEVFAAVCELQANG